VFVRTTLANEVVMTGRSYGVLLGLLLLGAAGSASASTPCELRGRLAQALAEEPTLTWEGLRASCQSSLEDYRHREPVGFAWFTNAANGHQGIPLALLLALPHLAPEIWGAPEERFSRFGFFVAPGEEQRSLPRGLGVAASSGRPLGPGARPLGEIDYAHPSLYVVTLACGACHSGRVRVGDELRVLEGAPSTEFDVRAWRAAFTHTAEAYLTPERIGSAEQPGETTRRLAALLDGPLAGRVAAALPGLPDAQRESVERQQLALVKSQLVLLLQGVAASTKVRAAAVDLQTRPGSSYGHGARSPGLAGSSAGQSDGSGDLIVQLLAADQAAKAAAAGRPFDREALLRGSYEELPPFATVTDAPSVWNQQARSLAQWDGSVRSPFWRNIAAQLPIVGTPAKIDLVNTYLVAEFLEELPSAPYPFEVDLRRAARGEALFAESCADCHQAKNERIYSELQTDFNRAAVLSPAGRRLFLLGFAASCHDRDFEYRARSGAAVKPCQFDAPALIRDTGVTENQGYVAGPLDGIWARAPYLHNGSVPTLQQLLVPAERPDQFLRAAVDYDPVRVGFAWETSRRAEASASPTLWIYDTHRDGLSNRGHDKDLWLNGKFYRLDWSGARLAEDRAALIEYLKTL
jgi:hypothetical protein